MGCKLAALGKKQRLAARTAATPLRRGKQGAGSNQQAAAAAAAAAEAAAAAAAVVRDEIRHQFISL
ncbi:hypothetical protein N9L68_04555 [bacterium]|nr:hypothetical protein [bacterium]